MAGYRSPLIPLGISAPSGAANPGYFSPLGIWVGGVGAPGTTAPSHGGFCSLMGFWTGGVCAPHTAPPVNPPVQPTGSIGLAGPVRVPIRRRKRDEDELLEIIAVIADVICRL